MSDLLKTTRGDYARTLEACFRAGHAIGAAYMYGVLGGKALSVSDPEFVALMQRLANGGIDASGNAWEAWSDRNEIALMEPKLSGVRAGLEAARSVADAHQCRTLHEFCDCSGFIGGAIGRIDAESIAKEAQRAAE